MSNDLTFENLPNAVSLINEKLVKIEQLLLNNSRCELSQEKDQLLTIKEASSFLNLSIPTIYSKVSKGELPVMKRTKRLYFSRLELIQYLKEGKRKSNLEIRLQAKDYTNNSKNL